MWPRSFTWGYASLLRLSICGYFPPASRPPGRWRPGVLSGLAFGVAVLTITLVAIWLPAAGAVLRPLSVLALLCLTAFAGAAAARPTGKARDGALAGFWSGIVAAALIACLTLALDIVFASTLVHSIWAHDPTCPQSAATELTACEIGDTLGFVAIELTILPLLLAGVGAFGGVIGRANLEVAAPRQGMEPVADAGPERISSCRAPIIFSGVMLALFLAEIILRLV